jgi:hypothetical protein
MSKPLFIHIPKNAGTAINQSGLAVPVVYEFASKDQKEIEENIGIGYTSAYKHLPLTYLDSGIKDQFNKKFAIVRNPWSKTVSMYNYADKLRSILPKNHPNNYDKITFKEFLERRHNWVMSPSFYRELPYDHWAKQSSWLAEGLDILRYENLNNDLSNYLGKEVSLSFVNVGTYSDDYRTYYDKESYQEVFDWYKEDIDRWGFTFDSGATKNYWMKDKI